MLTKLGLRLPRIEWSEMNVVAAALHASAAILAVSAILSDEWISIDRSAESNSTDTSLFDLSNKAEPCNRIGCRYFWRPVEFGGLLDQNGKTHVVFHFEQRVLFDCVTPVVANLFYVLIALCFVITDCSIMACLMNLLPPPGGFLQWIRRNTLLEICNMILTLFCCILTIVAQTEVDATRPDDDVVSLGSGVFFVVCAGLFSFLAAASHARHMTKMNRARRIDNQRLLCSRSLRSWRDSARRSDDLLPIVDFERYLDSASLNELAPEQLLLAEQT